MRFDLDDTLRILSATPATLDAWLRGLPEAWIHADEGGESWSPFVILGHLVHGERTDWMARLEIILAGEEGEFEPFDRFAQLRDSKGKSLEDLLREFAQLRQVNLEKLRAANLRPEHLEMQGRHPALGRVTLRQLLATWTTHDLAHLRQIGRVLAKQYATEVGPWERYLPVLREGPTPH